MRTASSPVRPLIVRALIAVALLGSVVSGVATATIVRFETVLGNIDVRLYDKKTPLTTQNFMNYVDDGDFNDTFFHRSVPGFVIQGGGYKFTDAGGVTSVPSDPSVMNEFGLTNIRGTIAMAKLGSGPNTATNQWFFNLADNASNLDNQNGGFTVFGRVLGVGMTVVDAIAAVPIYNAGSPFDALPLRNYVSGNIQDANLVNVTRIIELNLPAGDYNFDGVVNNLDFNVWKSTYLSTTNASADGNGDGVVNAADFTVWRDSMLASGHAVTVPEPTAAALAVLGLAAAARRLRRS